MKGPYGYWRSLASEWASVDLIRQIRVPLAHASPSCGNLGTEGLFVLPITIQKFIDLTDTWPER